MTAALPDWIRFDGAAGDIAALVPELETIAGLARNWRAIGAGIRQLQTAIPVDSPVRLAGYLAEHAADGEVAALFGTLGLADLHGKLVLLGARLADPQAPWAKLLRPVSEFVPADAAAPGNGAFGFDAAGEDGELALSVPRLAASGGVSLAPAELSFDLGAEGSLSCEAGSPWPFRADAVPGGLLRIGGEGRIRTRAGLSLPFGQLGKGTAHAGAECTAAAGFFFRPADAAQPFAEALAGALVSIPSPLDLGALSHAMALSGLEGMAFGCDGAVDAGLGVVLGQGFDIPGAVSGTFGITAEVAFKRNARWIVSLRQAGGGMRFVLSRDELREREWSAGLDLHLDAASLLRRVHDLLIAAQTFAGPVLDRVKPFLSPGNYLATTAAPLLKVAAASILDQPDLREAFEQDLALVPGEGDAATSALADQLAARIADAAATHTDGILAELESWTATVVSGLVGRVPGLAATGLPDALAARIQPLLGDVKGQFAALLDSLAGNAATSAALAAELAKAGAAIKDTERDADRLLAGVRDAIDKFNAFARRVADVTADQASGKLQARFGWSGADSGALKYELVGTISEVNADTSALWRALLTGRLQPFQQILADPALAPAGLHLAPESSLSRFVATQRGFVAEIVILGIDLTLASIVSGKAAITTNAAGDITVAAEGSALRKVDGFDEGRSASFISSWDLMLLKGAEAAGARRAMALGIGFDHTDKDLKHQEVEGLLAGLSAQGLIEPARVTRALGIYQDWRIKAAPGGKVRGKIGLRLQLPDTAVQRMVAIGRQINRRDNATLLALFDLAVRTQIAAGVTSDKQCRRDIEEAKDAFTISIKTDDPAAYMLALYNSKISLLPGRGEGPQLPALAQVVPRAGALIVLLGTMAQIYDAVPAPGSVAVAGAWTEAQYAEAERRMASASRNWLRLNQNFVFWFKSSLHPALLAFLRLLVAMNRPLEPGSSVPAGLDGPIDTAASSPLFLITMAAGEGEKGQPI